jgi:hypothetical protein
MRIACILILLTPLLAPSAGDKKKDKREPEAVEVVEIKAVRPVEERTITIDGRIRNAGQKPIERLTLVFDILGPDGEVVSRQRGAIDEAVLDPGQESEFHWQMRDHAPAVDIRVGAVNHDDVLVEVRKPGPYTIE